MSARIERDGDPGWGRRATRLAALGLAMLVIGCATTAPPERFHTLLPAEPAAPAAANVENRAAVYVDVLPVSVPAQVEHRQFVVRQPDDSLLMLEQDRWAAPLQDELRSALVQRLASDWGAVDIRGIASPSVPVIWRVRVTVQRFESLPGTRALLEATWSLTSNRRDAVTVVCRSALAESAGAPGVPALIAAHRRAVQQLADHIGRRLQAAHAGGTPGC